MAQTQWAQVEFMADGEGYGQHEDEDDCACTACVFTVSLYLAYISRLNLALRL